MPLYITYNNNELTDGYGAQLLRIIGIYSLAKITNCKYLHSPIRETIEEFAHNVSDQEQLDELTKEVNNFFALPGEEWPDKFDREVKVKSLGLRCFLKIYIRYIFSRKKVILRVVLPFGCTEKFPSIYRFAVSFIRRNNSTLFANHQTNDLVIHIRMGYGQKTPVARDVPPRFLPIEYYLAILKSLPHYLSLRDNIKVTIHTDVAPLNKLWKPTAKRLTQNINFGEIIEKDSFEVQGTDLNQYFHSTENLAFEIRYCDDFFKSFLDMACARNLIISRSAFSYLAALFNEGHIVWPYNHGHARLYRWFSSADFGIPTDYKLIPG
jgi:hypothetical protein